ncbi:MAG: VCBS repeat-containing protein [Methylovulum sp.]|uniref:FG-GAP repeat domain-containing protein n=1 Tax=Methylovulum sp. TaxID=1916980 RepID=UPI00262F2F58|nr:VCBS repeat-containing protein [Methylovulum sp.]MDD2725432.1 VCBS repeat-containing protein [Methylovulum sp.]MDD5124469.1 VCBS repeat-containing protein [Methylovulum sp.]
MKLSRLMTALFAISFNLASPQAFSFEKPVPTDRAGRPVIGLQGHINYATPAIVTKTANAPTQATVSATSPIPNPSSAAQLTTQWVAKIFGWGIGATGMMHIDINNDGIEEIVFASNIGFEAISVLSYQKTNNFWAISRQNALPSNSHVTAIYTYRNASNNAMLAYAIENQGKVSLKIQNLTNNTPVKEMTLNTQGTAVNEILLGDADNDGGNELIAVTDNTSHFFNIADYSASGKIAYGAAHAAIGNVDNDAENELIYNNGKVVSYKNTKASLEWDYFLGFGNFVRVANVDSDAPDEIIAADPWYSIRALDADIKSVKWEHATDINIDALRIADINSDGKDDIIYGDGQWGQLHALNGSGNEFWSLNNPEHGITDIAVLDADADGDKDIVWGSGYSSSGPDYLYISDTASKKQLYRNSAIDPPFRTVTFGDVDNDGKKEFITVTRQSESGYSDGVIKVIDADTGIQKWQSKSGFLGGLTWIGALAAAVGDVDNDGQNELVVVGDQLYDGAIYIVDINNHKLKKTIIVGSFDALSTVKIADIDGDGKNEIIAAASHVYVVDGATGTVKWTSHELVTDGVYGLEIADIDGNGNLDILVSTDYLIAFDGVTHANWISAAAHYSGIGIKPIKGKPAHNIVTGNRSGELLILASDLLTTKATYPVCPTAIGAVEMLNNANILFTCGEQLKLFDLSTKTVAWSSWAIAGGLETDALAVTKINGTLKVGLGATLSRLLRYTPAQ